MDDRDGPTARTDQAARATGDDPSARRGSPIRSLPAGEMEGPQLRPLYHLCPAGPNIPAGEAGRGAADGRSRADHRRSRRAGRPSDLDASRPAP